MKSMEENKEEKDQNNLPADTTSLKENDGHEHTMKKKVEKRHFFSSRQNIFFILALLFCLLGISDTLLLLYNELFLGGECTTWGPFGMLGGSCDTVTKSEYGHFFQIPISLLGFVTYVGLFFLLLISRWKTSLLLPIFVISFLGLAFSGYLVYLQALVIKRWCPLCLISAFSMTVLFFSTGTLFYLKIKEKTPPTNKNSLAKTFFLVFRYFFVIAVVALLLFEGTRGRLLMQKKQQVSHNLGCALTSVSTPFASIDGDLVNSDQLDKMFFLGKKSPCDDIEKLRTRALDMILIKKEMKDRLDISQKEDTPEESANYYRAFLADFSVDLQESEKIENVSDFNVVLQSIEEGERLHLLEELARLRKKYDVVINELYP